MRQHRQNNLLVALFLLAIALVAIVAASSVSARDGRLHQLSGTTGGVRFSSPQGTVVELLKFGTITPGVSQTTGTLVTSGTLPRDIGFLQPQAWSGGATTASLVVTTDTARWTLSKALGTTRSLNYIIIGGR